MEEKSITKSAFKKFQNVLNFSLCYEITFSRAFILSRPLGLFLALLSLCIAIGLASTGEN